MATNVEYEVDVKDVDYQRQGDKTWQARIYQPKGTGPFPTIVDVHGGAWNNGDRTNNVGVNSALAARGVLIAALDFRQPPEAGYPASIADINLGIRWLKLHAAEFNGSTKVGAFGNSSGGHQVVLAGLKPRDPRYAALPLEGHPEIDASLGYVIACWPVIDPLYRYKNVAVPGTRKELVAAHDNYWGTEAAMWEGAARRVVEEESDIDMPPILITLKDGDTNHPIAMQEAFVEAYRKRGGEVEMHSFVGLPEYRMKPGPDLPESVRWVDTLMAFIGRHSG
jgi:acetyl esterase/lipase